MFRCFISNMYEQIAGRTGEWVLSDNNKELSISKHIDMVNDYININLNDKKLLTKIYSDLKNKSLEDYNNYCQISESIIEYVQELLFDEEFDLVQTNSIDPIDIFKGVSIEIDDNDKSITEKFLEHIKISERFMDTKLFVFINLREFFNEEEVIQIYNKLLLNKNYFIIIQSQFLVSIDSREKLYIIDDELCEI